MRIVMLSRDASGLSADSSTAGRWRALRAEGAELQVVVMAREGVGWRESGLEVVPAVSASLPIRLAKAWRALRRLASGADLVTAQDPFELGAVAWAVARLVRVPFEVQDHGGFFDGGDVDEPMWPLRRRLAWFLVRRADAVRTVSPSSLDGLRRRHVDGCTYLLPIGADPRFAKVERRPEPGLVVSVGRLVPVKRMEILVEAIAIRRASDPSARLVLVGDGPERAHLEALASRVAPGAVDFVGAGDPAPWLARASVFCLASRHEGWGIAAVEAAMAGMPVLVSDTGCAGWLAERGAAKIVASADPVAWAAAMADPAPAAGRAALEYPQGPAAQAEAWRRTVDAERAARPSDMTPAQRKGHRKAALAIAALTFAVSLCYAFAYRIRPAVDASAYDQMGWNLASGRGLRLSLDLPLKFDEAITYQGPGYQFFLAGIYRTLGHHWEAVWVAQAFLRAATAAMVYVAFLLAFPRWRNRRAGAVVASLLIGLHPDFVEMGSMLMTETLYLFVQSAFLLALLRHADRGRAASAAGVGLLFGVACLTRSSASAFLPAVAWACLWRRPFRDGAIVAVAFAATLTPWVVRNAKVYHAFLPTMANYGYNFWVGNRVGGDGEGGNPPSLREAQFREGMVEANAFAFARFKEFLHEHPGAYVALVASRAAKTASFVRPMGFWFYQTGLRQALFVASSVVVSFIMFLLAALGVVAVRRDRRDARGPGVGLIAWGVLATTFSVVFILFEARYRLPLFPFLALLAGRGAFVLLDRQAHAARAVAMSVSVVLMAAAASVAVDAQKIVAKFHQFFG